MDEPNNGNEAPDGAYYESKQEEYMPGEGEAEGKLNLTALGFLTLSQGMYGQGEGDYGDELDGDDDRNDGLNALVRLWRL